MPAATLFQRLFYPGIVFGAMGLHLWLTALGLLPQLVPTMVAVVVLTAVFFSERLAPFYRPWLENLGARELSRDGASTLILLPIIMAGCEYFWRNLVPQLNIWPNEAPFFLRFVLAVLLAEFFFYWVHRISHKVPLLWRYHSLHHSVGRVYWLNSGMLHPIDAFFNFFFYFLPILVLGVDTPVFLLFSTLTMVTGVMEHANVDFRAGPLNYIFNGAELHRWHHSTDVATSQKNCGKILIVWDLVFGTFYWPKHQQGIEQVGLGE